MFLLTGLDRGEDTVNRWLAANSPKIHIKETHLVPGPSTLTIMMIVYIPFETGFEPIE